MCQAIGKALPIATSAIGKGAMSADAPSGGHRQRVFFYFFWNFFADGLGCRHTIFADGRPSAKLWSHVEMYEFWPSDVTTCSKLFKIFTTASACDGEITRQVLSISDFVWILYNFKTLSTHVTPHVTTPTWS
jgi:hypothetical protein